MGRQLVHTIGSAIVTVTVAFGLLALLFPGGSGAATYASASAAIALATAVAGWPAGILATLSAGTVVAVVHLPPVATLRIDHPDEVAGLAIFLVNGVVVAATVSIVRRNRHAPATLIAPTAVPAALPDAPTSVTLVEPLTDREIEVLTLVAAGCTNEAIAGTLFVSINTVKTHLKNVYGKLGVASRTQAIRRALELGIIRMPALGGLERDERDAA